MHPTLRIVALTAALAALAPAAFADPVVLAPMNFDDLGAKAESLDPPRPVDVGVIQGLRFTGAYGYGTGMLDLGNDDEAALAFASIPNPALPDIPNRFGFLLNRQRGQLQTDIVITLAQNAARTAAASPAVFFQAVTFNLFTNGVGDDNYVRATSAVLRDDGTGKLVPITYDCPIGAGSMQVWSNPPVNCDFGPDKQIISLSFTAGGATFALDDMVVTLTGATDPGGNVPEPASYGLVGLALLAAGAAGRRKQRG